MSSLDKKMSIMEHLHDLRKSIFVALLALLLGSLVGYINSPLIIAILKKPIPLKEFIFLSPTEAFLVNLKLALLSGLVLSSPIIISTLAWFIAPGLTSKEKKLLSILAFVSSFLFIVGIGVAYWGALPLTLKFLFEFSPESLVPYISISYYFSFVVTFLLLFGISFQFPLLLFSLAFLGLVKKSFWQRQRKYVVLTLISLSLLLAPGADVFSQILLFFPLYLLFEITVFFLGFVGSAKKEKQLHRR